MRLPGTFALPGHDQAAEHENRSPCVIDKIVRKKVDVVEVGLDRFLAQAGLLKPGFKSIKERLVIGSDSSCSCIVRNDVAHKKHLIPDQPALLRYSVIKVMDCLSLPPLNGSLMSTIVGGPVRRVSGSAARFLLASVYFGSMTRARFNAASASS